MKAEELEKYMIKRDNTVVDAMQKIDTNSRQLLFVVDEKKHLEGVITDGDIRRWLIKTGELNGRVGQCMNSNPKLVCRKEIAKAFEIMEENSITAIPVITTKGALSDIIFKDTPQVELEHAEENMLNVPVVIMAGGKGTRLYPYTKILPKPLIPIGDIPIMERIINKFRDAGVQKFYVTVNYRKSMIKSYFNDQLKDYEICYVEESKPLGTAGSLKLLEHEMDKPFVVTNCDILIHANYNDIYKYHLQSGNELTIVSALKNIVVPYGVIHSSENGMVEAMEEKPKLSYFVNSGMYILNSDLLKNIPEDTFFHMTDLADQLLVQGRRVGMYPISEDSFLDMGEFEEMHRMEEMIKAKS